MKPFALFSRCWDGLNRGSFCNMHKRFATLLSVCVFTFEDKKAVHCTTLSQIRSIACLLCAVLFLNGCVRHVEALSKMIDGPSQDAGYNATQDLVYSSGQGFVFDPSSGLNIRLANNWEFHEYSTSGQIRLFIEEEDSTYIFALLTSNRRSKIRGHITKQFNDVHSAEDFDNFIRLDFIADGSSSEVYYTRTTKIAGIDGYASAIETTNEDGLERFIIYGWVFDGEWSHTFQIFGNLDNREKIEKVTWDLFEGASILR